MRIIPQLRGIYPVDRITKTYLRKNQHNYRKFKVMCSCWHCGWSGELKDTYCEPITSLVERFSGTCLIYCPHCAFTNDGDEPTLWLSLEQVYD